MLSGNIPDALLIEGATIDLSYNNFTWQGPDRPTCRSNMNLHLNLFRSSSTGNTLKDIVQCETNFVCPKYECSLHVNSGGNDLKGQRVKRDYNIENEAHGIQNPVILLFNASVVNNILEIRFYWAGKGTMRIPRRGVYGPLISAISVNPYFETCSVNAKKKNIVAYIGYGMTGLCLAFIILTAVLWRACLKSKDLEGLDINTVSLSLKQLKTATSDFNATNKIGEGGFGPVYKGTLADGTRIAVKQLSSYSKQGNREFLNEIGLISCLKHPNLVKLHQCCIEEDQLMLVYEYLENNSLANALFGSGSSRLILDWPTRFKICVGIAKGLSYLHEESRLKIVHRDIKASNVLLDKDLNPKISDFGLARLHEDEKSHITTRVAGTIGYMAPEYALWGHLSDKADVYSFGILILEIVSGKNNNIHIPETDCICLLEWACRLQKVKRYNELFDEKLDSQINKEEAETVVKVALLCTNVSPSMRPAMSEVVNMLQGTTSVPEIVAETSGITEDLRIKTMRDFHETQSQTDLFNTNQTNTNSIQTLPLITRYEIQSHEIQSGSRTQYFNTSRPRSRHPATSSDDQFDIISVDSRSY